MYIHTSDLMAFASDSKENTPKHQTSGLLTVDEVTNKKRKADTASTTVDEKDLPVSRLSVVEMKLIRTLLRAASNAFSNHGCNDMSIANLPEHVDIVNEISKRNGDDDKIIYDPNSKARIETQDNSVMDYFVARLSSIIDSNTSS